MNKHIADVCVAFIFFGWIPILALGKAIAWCIKATQEYKECKYCCLKQQESEVEHDA